MTSALIRFREEVGAHASSRHRALANAAGAVVLVVLATYVVGYLLRRDVVPVDFRVYRQAAEAIAAGESPYPWFVYPPLSALGAVPFTVLSAAVADFIVKALLIAGVLLVLAVIGVRDWRCYPLVLLWPPVNAAVQTGNITIPLALGAAFLWRWRERPILAGSSLGVSVAAKLLLWPLWIWLLATRRRVAAVSSIVAGIAVTAVTWAIVDLGALATYPDRLRQLNEDTSGAGYTFDTLAVDLGAPGHVARALMMTVALALLVAVVTTGRRGNESRSFVLAVGAALACSPIVWLHYFALLVVPVAVARPRLGVIWFIPLFMWSFAAGTGNGSTGAAAIVLAVVVGTLALAVRETGVDADAAARASVAYGTGVRMTTVTRSSP